MNDSGNFDLCVNLIVGALKLRNKEIIEACEKTLVSLLGSDYTTDVMTVAVLHLSESNPDICRWTLSTHSNLQSYNQLLEDLIFLAAYTLIHQGFIPGKDFSITHTNTVLINQKAQASLMKAIAPADSLLMEAVLLTGN